MLEPRTIVYVGMDLFPPYNEIQSKTVHMLVRNLPPSQPFRVVSFANPDAEMGPPPDARYIPVPGRSRVRSALGLTVTLIRETWFRRAIVHFVMPARHQSFVAILTRLCHIRRIPTIFTVMKRKLRARGLETVSVVVAQTRPAYEELRCLLPSTDVRMIVPGSSETVPAETRPRGRTVLFVGVPWSTADLEKRGVYMFFDVVRETLRRDPEVRFTLLNRALTQARLLEQLAAELPRKAVEIHHGSFDRMSEWYGRHSVFLILHRDETCPEPPLSAIEACCCGCAIVTTPFNGLARDLMRAGAGLEVAPTPQALAAGIVTALDQAESFRANAFELGRTQYSEASFSRAYEQLYHQLQNA